MSSPLVNLGGILGGYAAGRSSAGTTANMMSDRGSKTVNEEHARNLARITAPVGAVAGLALAGKHKGTVANYLMERGHIPLSQLVRAYGDPAGAVVGGYLGGAATGAAMSLRGKKKEEPKKEEEKSASMAKEAMVFFGKSKKDAEPQIQLLADKLNDTKNLRAAHSLLAAVQKHDTPATMLPASGETPLLSVKDRLLSLEKKK